MRNLVDDFVSRLPLGLLTFLVKLQVGFGGSSKPFFLAVNREIANRDLDAIRRQTREFEIKKIRGLFVYAISRKLVPREFRTATYNIPAEYFQSSMRLKGLVESLINRGLLGYVVFNTNYWNDQPFRLAVEAAGKPTFVIMKEAVLTQLHADQWRDPSFPAVKSSHTRIFVANFDTHSAIIANGTASSDQLVVSGLPRFDYFIQEAPGSSKPFVLYLSFASLLHERFWQEHLKCFELTKQICASNDYRLVVKLKDSREMNLWKRKGLVSDNHPFDLVWKSDIRELIRTSNFCVGGPSLSSVEALMMGKTVLFPAWGELADSRCRLYHDPDFDQLVVESTSPDAFGSDLQQLIDRNPSTTSANKNLRPSRWACQPDEGASVLILRHLKEFAKMVP